jgi:hypothetical protein
VFRELYSRNGFQFGAADIFCIDAIDLPLPARLAELLSIFLLGVRDTQGVDPIRDYLIVLPAAAATTADVESTFREHLAERIRVWRGNALAPQGTEILGRRIRVQHAADLYIDTAINILQSIRSHTVVIICECALYRDAQITSELTGAPKPGATLPEDIWVPHVHRLAARGTEIATQKEAYVIFDVGESPPRRATNDQLLKSVDPCGMVGMESPTDPMTIFAEHADEWAQHERGGRRSCDDRDRCLA